MNQTAEHQRPDIDVTITAELRALYAARYGRSVDPDDASEATEEGAPANDLVREPVWETICLRRDGARPRRFIGMKVHEVAAETAFGDIGLQHGLAFYQERDGDLICALRVTPEDPFARRPGYWCEPVTDAAEFMQLMRRWMRDVLGSFLSGTHPAEAPCPGQDHLLAQFNALTAQCLRTAQTH